MLRFATNLTMMFTEHAFLDRFAAAAAAGFDAVEFLFPYEHPPGLIAEALARHGLTQALFNLPPGDWAAGDRGMAALPERQEEFRASVAVALDYARATGVGRLHVMSGLAEPDDTAARQCYAGSLDYLCDQAGAAGVDVLIEPINRRDMPGYFLCGFDQALDVIATAGHANLKLQYDIYHRQILHGDVLVSLRKLMPVIGHIQIAAVPLRHEPGSGELNDMTILRTLDRLGYSGFVGCEYRPEAGTVAGLGWMKNI